MLTAFAARAVDISAALAWCGTALGLARTTPQLLVVRREQALDGLSVWSCTCLMLSMVWWDIYSIAGANVPLAVSSVGSTIAPVLTLLILSRRGLVQRRHALAVLGGSVLGLLCLLVSVEFVGLVASGSTVLYAGPQLWRLVRTRDVRGVSAVTWGITAVNTSIWAAYGIREQLLPTVLPALILLPTACLVMTLKLLSKRRGSAESSSQNTVTTDA